MVVYKNDPARNRTWRSVRIVRSTRTSCLLLSFFWPRLSRCAPGCKSHRFFGVFRELAGNVGCSIWLWEIHLPISFSTRVSKAQSHEERSCASVHACVHQIVLWSSALWILYRSSFRSALIRWLRRWRFWLNIYRREDTPLTSGNCISWYLLLGMMIVVWSSCCGPWWCFPHFPYNCRTTWLSFGWICSGMGGPFRSDGW